jgi:hypothetical protein
MSSDSNRPYKVTVIESERGWGQKVLETKYFTGETAKEEAEAFAKEINRHNVGSEAPDYYVAATVSGC